MADAASNATGVASAETPINISAQPKIRRGRPLRATMAPAIALPSAKPAMKAARTGTGCVDRNAEHQ